VAQLLYATVFSTISLIIVACAGCIVADTQLTILGWHRSGRLGAIIKGSLYLVGNISPDQ